MFYLRSVLPLMVSLRLRLLLLGSASSPTQRNHVHSIEFKIIFKRVEYPKKDNMTHLCLHPLISGGSSACRTWRS